MIARVRQPRKALACCACGGDMRMIFADGTLLCLCLPCAATYSRAMVEGTTTTTERVTP